MWFRQIYEEGLAQASYIVGCPASGEALVVDPRRDIDVYLQEAQKAHLRIVAVTETHIHADFLSGARELAQVTGAELLLSREGGEGWQYRGLEGLKVRFLGDGEVIQLDQVQVTALHTPGHTPEHLSFLITDRATSQEPSLLLSGDFVFVGDLGRPDLLEEAAGIKGTAEPGARQMYQSLKKHFLKLPDYIQVWPGHGAGSACGRALGAVPSTTVGFERRFAWWAPYLEQGDEDGFVRALLEGQPEAPTYFGKMKQWNRDGHPLLTQLPEVPELKPEELQAALEAGAILVDTRDKLTFAAGHWPGSINIPFSKNFSTWAGWLLPYDRPLILLASREQVPELTRRLIRVGLDRIQGYLPRLPEGQLERVESLSPHEAKALWEQGEVVILDVRAADEYRSGHIPGAQHLHAGRVMNQLHRIPKDRPLLVHCLGGDRSSIAISALKAAGFRNLFDLKGGIEAWRQAGLPLEE
jgi:hydroxyacylglutathione hydrolase